MSNRGTMALVNSRRQTRPPAQQMTHVGSLRGALWPLTPIHIVVPVGVAAVVMLMRAARGKR